MAVVVLALPPGSASAQSSPLRARQTLASIGAGVAIVAAAAGDARIERWALAHRDPTLDRLGDAGNVLGSGRYLIPTLAVGWIGGRLSGRPSLQRAATHAIVAYTAGNVVVSLLKPAIGRHRPDSSGSQWRFRPFASAGDWHSLPSAHTLHAVTIAAALADDARQPALTAGAIGAGALVAWSRVYRDEHWTSDVLASAVIGVGAARLTRGLSRRLAARTGTREAELQPAAVPGGFGVRLAFGGARR